jgi:hypothetical protein
MMVKFLRRTAIIVVAIMVLAVIASVPAMWFMQNEIANRAAADGITPEEELEMNLGNACAHGIQLACR